MKKLSLIFVIGLSAFTMKAQNDVDALLIAGAENAQRFTNDYLAPGTNGLMYSMNGNWFNTAHAKPLGGFEISLVMNASLVSDDDKSFLMNIEDYNSPDYDFTVAFADGATSKQVATALGENNPEIDLIISEKGNPLSSERITLPSGIGNASGNLLPSAFIQGSVGLIKGLEVKARFMPEIKTDDVAFNMYGAGLQFEATKWLPADKLLPIALSGLVAYTHLGAAYDLTDSSGVDGENQKLENDTSTWLFQFIASTKLPVINFYGGLGYISGKSESDLLGTYTVTTGPLSGSQSITDPFSVSSEISGMRGTLGTKLKIGFFRFNAEYHLAEFNAFSVGINFGFR
ncbi:DUF6588 family protein [Aestuariibaculum sediminum]|uniref:Outer membrane protein beta-barrel domain-containing protein n=1 Tax=Aestuariibaculum sediminum TaxID=2770637 RepID=A0A8J6U7Q7_9FLAO|nr:DUF6588 family protein [Aestuariibaculum sediminum]MBD0832258.1 hypothetical protein [Aestuariibaculum sediminum]